MCVCVYFFFQNIKLFTMKITKKTFFNLYDNVILFDENITDRFFQFKCGGKVCSRMVKKRKSKIRNYCPR